MQIVRRVCQFKIFENQSVIGKNMDKNKVPRFSLHCMCANRVTNVYTIFHKRHPFYFFHNLLKL